ncbi:alcohol dehydrogenase (nADP+) [Fusarium flagelliforme]|uniref:Alcohol dehydrogenase (NADP+) n=2 Tax=Fusarium flagelliforme TaxID=2675880 RepID=A0A395MDL5_9HYPO|nr:alcohol dehydrogenase (nADP+) [Fusarium flagelliforme]
MTSQPSLLSATAKLNNGLTIPCVQLGLYMMSTREATDAVRQGLLTGYRAFDCAQMYRNERQAGKAISDFLASSENKSGLKREDIWYTSKLASCDESYDVVRRSVKKSVEASGLGYIDLFLLHSPYGGKEARLTSWKALEDAIDAGEIRAAGVSNFGSAHIEELMASNPRIPPVINQIEVHPFNTQEGIRATCAKHNIAIEAYAPLARAERMDHPAILDMAKKYSVTPAQIFVKWGLQHDFITLPKSTKQKRMIENATVDGFEISESDMKALDALDEHLVTDWDPTDAP